MSYTPATVISNPIIFFNALDQTISEIPGTVRDTITAAYNANRGNAQELGKVLQAIGAGIHSQPGATNEVVGRSLDYLGKLLEHGTAVAPEFSSETMAQAGISILAGAAATAVAVDIAFAGLSFILGGELLAAIVIGAAFTAQPLVAMVLVGGFAYMIAQQVEYSLVNPLMRILKDPLILDLDGDGIELISLANSNAYLDYGGDGFAERTGWVKGDDGVLVFDRNANGAVVGIGEMFGSATQDGFEVLETLDTNNDGKITLIARLRHDASDAEFANIRVWQDANEDGISDTGELKTLAELRRIPGSEFIHSITRTLSRPINVGLRYE